MTKKGSTENEPSLTDKKKKKNAVYTRAEKHIPFMREQLVTLVQTAICVLLVVTALILRALGGSFYARIATWYFDRVNDSLFVTSEKPDIPFEEETTVSEISRITFSDKDADIVSEADESSSGEEGRPEAGDTSRAENAEISGSSVETEPAELTVLSFIPDLSAGYDGAEGEHA